MKIVAISQRIDFLKSKNEKRDSLDQKYIALLKECGYLSIPIPNNIITNPFEKISSRKKIKTWLKRIKPDYILFSGGNDIGEYSERDNTELLILEYVKENKIPLLAICRGMQLLAWSEGCDLIPVNGHIGLKHFIKGEINQEVLCFHNFTIKKIPNNFQEIARSEDGLIEGIRHNYLPIEGWMWHPERLENFSKSDLNRIKNLFC